MASSFFGTPDMLNLIISSKTYTIKHHKFKNNSLIGVGSRRTVLLNNDNLFSHLENNQWFEIAEEDQSLHGMELQIS